MNSPDRTAWPGFAEAEAVARLQHPGIVQIYEVGERDGRPFFSLEYMPGGSLDDLIDRRPQPPRAAAEVVQTLAEAVHQAHIATASSTAI